jgi:hypothetical protein
MGKGDRADILQVMQSLEVQLSKITLCSACKARASKWIKEERKNVWSMLPTLLGMESWDKLRERRENFIRDF